MPAYANNAIVYHITETTPLSEYLKSIAPESLGSILVPEELTGYKFQFLNQIPSPEEFDNIKNIPTKDLLPKEKANKRYTGLKS